MYKWNAEDDRKNSANQQRWAREVIAKLELKGNEKILDIGCGDRIITAEIASYLPNGSVLGVDISPEMIDFARNKFPDCDYPNLSFQCQDATKLNFHNEFDAIVSFYCLHWITDQSWFNRQRAVNSSPDDSRGKRRIKGICSLYMGSSY